jgi:hypothetical protein
MLLLSLVMSSIILTSGGKNVGNLDNRIDSVHRIDIVVGESLADKEEKAKAVETGYNGNASVSGQRYAVYTRSQTDTGKIQIENEIYQEATARWNESEALDVLWIVNQESGFNPKAVNGRCFGLFQRLGYTETDPDSQITNGLDYIQERYKLPSEAKAFHLIHNYY